MFIQYFDGNSRPGIPVSRTVVFDYALLMKRIAIRERIVPGIKLVVGYILSPLSWWNDLVINVPLAYAFSYPFSLLGERWFLPAFVLGYWLTNLAGFYLLHKGVLGLTRRRRESRHWRAGIAASLVYTLALVVLVQFDLIPPPAELLAAFTKE